MLKLGVRGTVNSIMLVNKNTVAVEALGLAVCPVLLKVLHPHTAPLVSNVRRGQVKRMSKQVDTLGSPRAMSVPLPLLGLEAR